MINDSIRINYKDNLIRVGLTSGQFKLLFNIYQNVLGSNIGGRVYISEISPSRTEIKVKLVDENNTIQWDAFDSIDTTERVGNYVANFGNNNTILITNWIKDNNNDLILKLYEQLPIEFDVKIQLWISKVLAESFEQEVEVSTPQTVESYSVLSGPNWNIPLSNVIETDSGFKSWNDVLSTETNTSENLIDKYFSQSFGNSAELNVDYSDYNNFVHFGNAQEKLDNFVYKLELIEAYDVRSSSLSDMTSSLTVAGELTEVNRNRRKVINEFDGYEKYLYYETSSNYTIERTYNVSSSVESYYATTWPKSGDWSSYELYSTTSSEAMEWYESQSAIAIQYDNLNIHSLLNTIPEYIKFDKYNDEYILFTNMIGHFFDNIWIYINAFNDLHSRENDISLGISKDLVYDMLDALGIKLNNGNNLVDLWQYEMGGDVTGSYLNTGAEFKSLSGRDITIEIWNRILNNLPYLLKTRGTKRGIQALITCYGIPSTLLNIKEYGGPVEPGIEWDKEHKVEKFFSYLSLSGSAYITGSWPDDIETVEMRVNFTDNYDDKESIQSIFKTRDTELYISKSGTNGVVKACDGVTTVSSSELRLFDGDFWNIMLISSSDNQLYIKKYKDGEKIYSENIGDASFAFPTMSAGFTIGSGSFDGGIHEVRFWNESLLENDFIEHAKSPESIKILNGNAYDNLYSRYAFNSPENLAVSTSIYDSCPDSSKRTIITASEFTSETTYPYNYQTSTYLATPLTPSIGYGINSNKTRVEDNTLLTSWSLQPDIRSEIRGYDYAPLDSPRIGVYFSLTNLINERIVEVYSNQSFDDYIGDPAAQFTSYYPELESINQDFWAKYAPTMSFHEYLDIIKPYDPSLFDIIKSSLPARTKKQVGLVVESNILQRSRVPIQPNPTWEDELLETSMSTEHTSTSGELFLYEDTVSVIFEDKMIGDLPTYDTLLENNTTNDILSAENETYFSLLKASEPSKATQTYITFMSSEFVEYMNEYLSNKSNISISYPTIYPKCNFMTSSAYMPSGSSLYELKYSSDNYVLNSDKSKGYLRPRYIGCLQTEDTTLDGKAPVEIFITTTKKLITKDGGKINLAIK